MAVTRKSAGSNPFYDDEEVDDFEFLSHPKQGRGGYLLGSDKSSNNEEWEQRRLQLLEERNQIQQRTLQGTASSLGLLHESEQIGVATADELVRQREQLENVEDKVDEISATMRVSQKHLTAMKSLFGGIKSYFSRSNSSSALPVKDASSEESDHPSALQKTVDKVRANSTVQSEDDHPAFRIRGIYSSDVQSPVQMTERDMSSADCSLRAEQQIDSNLAQMNVGLDRLKSLALGLGEEIGEQNDMLDRITGKVEKSEDTLQCQNRQMRRILKK